MEAALEESMSEGPYEALPSSEHIRLIRLEGKPPEQEYLSFVMEIFLITDSALPNYRALSYTWGSPVVPDDPDDIQDSEDAIDALIKVAQQISLEDSEEPMVFCNGYAMVVTSNLHDALYQLADYTDVGHIWCDALCINQADSKEKSVCIPIMGDIFSSATTVIVWLGNDTKYLKDFEWLHDSDSLMIEEAFEALDMSRWDCKEILLSGGTGSGEDEIEMLQRWASYRLFYDRLRFFTRSWILQEVALAREIWVHCGSKELCWDSMAALATLLRHTGSPVNFVAVDEEGAQHFAPAPPPGDKMARIGWLRDQCAAGSPENGAPDGILKDNRDLDGITTPRQCLYSYLKHLLKSVRIFEATDPHDKIFSVLGMVKRYLPPGVSIPIDADYSMPVEELYTAITFKCIQELPLLSVLSMVEDRSWRKTYTLPSWVPDFSQTRPLTQLADLFYERGIECRRYLSGKNHPRRRSGRTLYLHGAFIDTIQETTPPEHQDQRSYDFKNPTIFIWLNSMMQLLAKQVRRPYFTGEDYMDVFWKTHMAYIQCSNGDKNLNFNDPEKLSESFRSWLIDMLTIPLSLTSKHIGVYISLMHCVKKIVTHTHTKFDRWLGLQHDIARYSRSEWAQFLTDENGNVRLGDWPIDPVEAAEMIDKLSCKDNKQNPMGEQEKGQGKDKQKEEKTTEEKDLTLAKAFAANDDFAIAKALQAQEDGDEIEMLTLMDGIPQPDIAEAECTELTRKKREYSHQQWATLDRLMLVTEKGYIGLCPESSRKGDQIWYIEDAAVLFVLRPRNEGGAEGDLYDADDETFELMGEAFVHGLMGGELLGDKNKFRGEVEPVALR